MTSDAIAILVSVAGLIITAGSMLIGGVWIVSKVQSTTENLSGAIDRLDETLQSMDNRQRDHGDRITRLEAGNGKHL
jgi:predicted PurR-regulated permease PerM